MVLVGIVLGLVVVAIVFAAGFERIAGGQGGEIPGWAIVKMEKQKKLKREGSTWVQE